MTERNFKLTLEYDGTGFAGWQVQPGQRTVQGVLEDAATDLCARFGGAEADAAATHRSGTDAERVAVTGAGRTDAGVHALGQVASASLATDLDASRLMAALNARLPDDVLLREAEEVDPSFHARFDATSRHYLYLLSGSESPLWRGRRWFVRYDLDKNAMRKAASVLEGEHDFSSFCIAGSEPSHHRCRVERISLEWESAFGGILALHVEADRFLRGMVRSIVGTLVDVGRGRNRPEDVSAILEAGDRGSAGATAPAHGLYLVEVRYDR